jgi:tRNA modification GTPase
MAHPSNFVAPMRTYVMLNSADTIYALSSGSLPSGVAVVRISGAGALTAAERLIGSPLPQKRQASLRMVNGRNGEMIDQALVLVFPGPNSFTGEDCVELQVHGSRAVIAAVFSELSEMSGLRLAEAGEFSRRAFENGKMDLVEVEGLADLLLAESEMQRRLAIEQSSGHLSALYDGWAKRLTHARAMIEAELDFADEEDVPDSVSAQVWIDVTELRGEITAHLQGGESAEIIRDGFRVTLSGEPNVGKSSLMNALSGRDVAIVTDIAGTTRDVLSVDMNIDGYLVHMSDTAGIRETDDVVEQQGVLRAIAAAERADIVLVLTDSDSVPEQDSLKFEATERLIIKTKSDLALVGTKPSGFDLEISTLTGQGLTELRNLIKEAITSRVGSASMLAPARARHKKRLEETLICVSDALNSQGADLAIRSEFLRLAASALGRITGRVDVEDLLGIIFSEFCIGK